MSLIRIFVCPNQTLLKKEVIKNISNKTVPKEGNITFRNLVSSTMASVNELHSESRFNDTDIGCWIYHDRYVCGWNWEDIIRIHSFIF